MYLFEWLRDVLSALSRWYADNWGPGGPSRRMGWQLRVMYGRGEIDREVFFRLRSSLEKGFFIEGELQTYHHQGILRLQREGKYVEHHFDPTISRGLESIYYHRARLAEVRYEMGQALETMAAQREWILKQAESIRESAQAALPDDAAARAYLEIRQDLLDRVRILDQRAGQVQQNLGQIDMLEAELGVSEVELRLVDSQEHYADINLSRLQSLPGIEQSLSEKSRSLTAGFGPRLPVAPMQPQAAPLPVAPMQPAAAPLPVAPRLPVAPLQPSAAPLQTEQGRLPTRRD